MVDIRVHNPVLFQGRESSILSLGKGRDARQVKSSPRAP